MPRKHHVHKYRKVKLGRNGDYVVFACSLPDCSHFVPADLALGKWSLCWRCGDKFALTEKAVMLSKPHCISCTRGMEEKIPIREVEIDESIFDGLIPRVPKA